MSFGGEELPQNNQTAGTMRLAYTSDGTAVYKPLMPLPSLNSNNNNHSDGHNHNAENNFFPTILPQQQEEVSQISAAATGGVSGGDNNNTEPMKRKRGRPRKYTPEDGSVDLITSPQSHEFPSSDPAAGSAGGASSSVKKARGRPPGSGQKNKLAALGSATGVGFVPHVITVKTGEDVVSKIMSLPQNAKRAICVLSANGAISNVTLRQAATSGGSVTYEGRFEILSLCGSFLVSENTSQRSRTGGLSILLAGPDGRVLGGGVAGVLIAASSVQVIVGSFMTEEMKASKLANHSDGRSAPPRVEPGIQMGGSPLSHGTLSESSGGPMSPHNQSIGAFNNSNPQGVPNMPWK